MKVLFTLLLAVAARAADEATPNLIHPYAGLGHLGYGGLGYAGLGHLGYAGLGYAGLPYAHAVVPATHEVTYKTYTPTIETNVVATNLPVPVAVGGYKAVAGDNGDLKGAVHEVPALFGAPALNVQTNEASLGSLTVGTSAVVTHTVGEPIVNEHTVQVPTFGAYGYGGHFYGKRAAEEVAAPVAAPLVHAGYPFAGLGHLGYGGLGYAGLGHLGYGGLGYAGLGYAGLPYAHAVVPATHEVTYKTYTPTIETNVVATNLPVPVAVGGYKAVAGDNGDLKGAVHEVPALFSAPALNVQTNEASQGSLTVGTSAVVTHSLGEPIVNEHTVQVPSYGVYGHGFAYGKREADAEAEADPYYAYGAYGHHGGYYGHGYGYGLHGYTGHHGAGHHGYGGYGYGLGHGYGHGAYGYAGHYYG
jgi:hypothetical protein